MQSTHVKAPAILEPAIRRIGEEIFERAEAAAAPIFSREYGQAAGIRWLGLDEDLKLRLFRFIEVLPSLRRSAAIASHFQDYLAREDGHPPLPGLLQFLLSYRRCDSMFASLVAKIVRYGATQGARQFICGTTPSEASAAVLRLRRRQMAFSLDVLGETVIADRVARDLQQLYIKLIEEVGREAAGWPASPVLDLAPWGPIPRVNLSIKLTGLVAKFDPIDVGGTCTAVLDRLRPILRAARRCGAFVNVDMEHYAVKDLTLEIYRRVLSEAEFCDWPDCGIVIQTYLPEGERDMAELIAWARGRGTPITVRLVKGAYWDAETAGAIRSGRPIPVYTQKWQSDAAFERVAGLMLRNADIVRPAFASHNVRSIAAVLAMEEALELPPRTVELQMLTGMGDPLKRAVVEMGRRLRVYAPFGNLITGMAYLIRRLIENTANESFLRQSFGGDAQVDSLLMPPRPDDAQHSPAPRPFIRDPDEYCEMNPFENAAEADFSRAQEREAMSEALGSVRARFGRGYAAVIDGAAVETGKWTRVLNPSNPDEWVGSVAVCDCGTADRAVDAARQAFESWGRTSAGRRVEIVSRAGELLHERRFEMAAWLVYEVGKTWREAHGDVTEAVDYLRYYGYEMERLSRRSRLRNLAGEANEYLYAPRGVAAVISPVSFPLALLTGMTAAALAAGNTVVAKPATRAGLSAAKLVELLVEAGLPRGVLNFVPGPGAEVGDHLVRHPDVDMIAFTGSSEVGRGIIAHARSLEGRRSSFMHVIADMGGKNAVIVDDDADLDEAVQATIDSAFGFSGQKCTSCSRVIALSDIHDEFVAKLVEAARGIKPGPADLPGTTVGPMVDAESVERARQWVEAGKLEARCVLEGESGGAGGGYYFSPVIFVDAASDSRIAQEEMLAPILTVIRAGSFEDAIKIANGTPYALTAGVFSRSPRHIEIAKRRLEVGTLYVNRKTTVSRVDRQPFGGFRLSGLGTKTGGPDYLVQFMQARTVCENTMRHGFAPASERSGEASRTTVIYGGGGGRAG